MATGNFFGGKFFGGGFFGKITPSVTTWGNMPNRRERYLDDDEDIQDIVAIAMQALGEDDD